MRTISEPHNYTPVASFATTEPTAATITCECHGQMLVGKLRRVHCKATFTDVGSGGSGTLRISLPSAPATNSASTVLFSRLTGVVLPTSSVTVLGRVASTGVSIYGLTVAGVETALAWSDLGNGDVIEFVAEYMEA